jgi:starch synthase
MQGGIIYSNSVTTVSPSYAAEALDGGAAGWLRATLARPEVRAKFVGVLNGIDTALWDPARDPLIPAPFTPERLEGKALCKRYLQRGLGLAEAPEKPLVACITRLVPQKGIHLIRHAVYRAVELGGQFVLLGSGHADGDFRAMADADFRDSRDVSLKVQCLCLHAARIFSCS